MRWGEVVSFIQFCVDVYALSLFIRLQVRCAKQFQGFQEHASTHSRIKNEDSITDQPTYHTCDVSVQTYLPLLAPASGIRKGKSCLVRGESEAAPARHLTPPPMTLRPSARSAPGLFSGPVNWLSASAHRTLFKEQMLMLFL